MFGPDDEQVQQSQAKLQEMVQLAQKQARVNFNSYLSCALAATFCMQADRRQVKAEKALASGPESNKEHKKNTHKR